ANTIVVNGHDFAANTEVRTTINNDNTTATNTMTASDGTFMSTLLLGQSESPGTVLTITSTELNTGISATALYTVPQPTSSTTTGNTTTSSTSTNGTTSNNSTASINATNGTSGTGNTTSSSATITATANSSYTITVAGQGFPPNVQVTTKMTIGN